MYEELIEKKDRASTTKFKKEFITKNNKAVRKRLSFVNINEKDINEKNIVKNDMNSENLSLTEKMINDIDLTNISVINHPEHSKLYTKNNEKMNYEFNFPSTSKNNVNLNIDNISNKISLINKNTDEDEDDCNMTYTQYLNKKLEGKLDISNIILHDNTSDIKTRLIIITTKFNPPSREKIINSMKMYDILELKSNTLFFSNKIDLMKYREKESNLSNSNIYNVIPFKCNLDKVTGIKLWRRVKINEFYPSGSNIKSCDIKRILAGYNSLIIHPLIHPPTSRNVKTWLKAKKYLSKKNKHKEINDYIDILKENNIKKTFNENMKYHSQCSNNLENSSESNNTFNPSLQEMLENPLLYMNDTRYLGISYGQIEYNLKEYSNNAEKENHQTARSLNMVIILH